VKRRTFADFFRKKQLLADQKEMDTLFRANLKMELAPNGDVKKSQFMGIISKAVMRDSLKNVYHFIFGLESGTKGICSEELEFS